MAAPALPVAAVSVTVSGCFHIASWWTGGVTLAVLVDFGGGDFVRQYPSGKCPTGTANVNEFGPGTYQKYYIKTR